MRSIRLLAVAVLAVILALSPAQNVFAEPVLTLNPACGHPGQLISFLGVGFGNAEHDPTIDSSPGGLISGATITITNRVSDSIVSGTFVVAAGASGGYIVTVHTIGIGQSASAGFSVGGCGPPPEPYELCLIQLGVEEPEGTVTWLPGYAIVDVPISQCENKSEYYADVLGRTIVIHQFNQTRISYETGTPVPVILII